VSNKKQLEEDERRAAIATMDELIRAYYSVANSIAPTDGSTGKDAAGGTVGCLTEAVMGVTAGLMAIAAAINHLAEVEERK
jgi:hypothetical protein